MPNDDALRETLRQATLEHLEQARPLLPGLGHRLSAVKLEYDLRGRAAGTMRPFVNGRLLIRYNLELAARQPEAFLAETVPHEVAHVVTWLLHGKTVHPHGPEWQAVMRHLGIESPRRCHDFDTRGTSVRRQRRWPYRCACREHRLTTTRHRRIQYGKQDYVCRKCGETLEWVSPEDGGD